jgi:phosphate transport system substrate-binding protein
MAKVPVMDHPEQAMNFSSQRHVREELIGRLRPFGALAILISLHASPFDKTPPLSTNHGPIKSGGTIKEAIQGSIDMFLTDMPMTDAELHQVQNARGIRLLHIATAVTAVVPCYNVAALKEPLNFSADTLAAIFLGKITKWNDPAIRVLNPSSPLPATGIIIIGHAVEDGSTYALTDFLTKTNADWRRSVGRARSLAALPALASGEDAERIVELVKRTPNSIGYMELWVAKGQDLQIGRVKNRAGLFVDASPASASAAAFTASSEIHDDFRASLTDASGPHDYPIASFTWIVIPNIFEDSEKQATVISFLKWALTDGQRSPESMHLGRLPTPVVEREIHLIEALQ